MCFSRLQQPIQGYKCLQISSGCVYISRDVVFDKNVFPFSKQPSSSPPNYTKPFTLLPLVSNSPSPNSESDQHGVDIDLSVAVSPLPSMSSSVSSAGSGGDSGDDDGDSGDSGGADHTESASHSSTGVAPPPPQS